MRALHIYRRFHPDYTGDGIYYTRLIPILAEHGISNEILVFETKPGGRESRSVHEGVVVHYLANRFARASKRNLLRWLAGEIWRFDVVHLHSHADRLFLSYAFARLCGRRVLFSCTLNDSPTQLLHEYRERYRGLVTVLMRSITTFVVISPHLLRLSLETVPACRLRFIPQGVVLDSPPVDAAERAAAKRALGLAEDDFLLLNVGSVSRRKNVAFLVDATSRMKDPSIKLMVVGPLLEPDYAAEIAAKVAAHGLAGRVVLTGYREDPQLYYAAADVFAFASTAEGFPNVFLEAMARNLPIVTLFLPGLTDFIVDHGRSGFLAQNMDQFVAAVTRLRRDPELCVRMGAANRRFAERNLDIRAVARSYAALYREGRKAAPAQIPLPDLSIRFTGGLAEGPASIGLREFDTPREWAPLLQIVIDTEADFDWAQGTATDVGQVSSIAGLERNFDIFRKHGVRPTLVIDHPVAHQEQSARIVRGLAAEGCEVGVHMHPWSTPPQVEPRDDWHSFAGNMGAMLETAKLETLTRRVEDVLGRRPRIFKAGRYGLSAGTVEALEGMGFEIDLSICPSYDYSHMGGPDFSRFTSRPGWFGRPGGLLSLPTTAAPLGWLSGRADAATRLTQGRWGKRLGLNRLAARLNMLYPVRLSPEGNDLARMRRLTRQLHGAGLRVFTLSLHSPTLQIGNTPYTRSEAEMRDLLRDIDAYLAFFRDELGGKFAKSSEIRARLCAAGPQRPVGVRGGRRPVAG